MNPTAVYSKSGKGVQEAAGKTSQLSRPDRAVLAAIDGRASLADVAQKVGRAFDNGFKQLIGQLVKDGFIRDVSSGSAAAGAGARRPAAALPAAKPSAPTGWINPYSVLDFTVTTPVARKSAPLAPLQPPPRRAAPSPNINVPPRPPPPSAEE